MELLAAFVRSSYSATIAIFTNRDFEPLYEFLFLSQHFPVLFVNRSHWVCLQIRHYHPTISWRRSLLLSLAMAFAGRAVVAYCAHRGPFLTYRAPYIAAFIFIWYLVNCSPGDVFFTFLRNDVFWVAFQMFYSVIQVRQICHGADIGLLVLPRGGPGAVLMSALMASTESFLWVIVGEGSRCFSNVVFLRNAVAASLYCAVVQNPDISERLGDIGKVELKLIFAVIYFAIAVGDMARYGIKGRQGTDVTMLSSLHLRYQGNK
jgi:hypothetical protein